MQLLKNLIWAVPGRVHSEKMWKFQAFSKPYSKPLIVPVERIRQGTLWSRSGIAVWWSVPSLIKQIWRSLPPVLRSRKITLPFLKGFPAFIMYMIILTFIRMRKMSSRWLHNLLSYGIFVH